MIRYLLPALAALASPLLAATDANSSPDPAASEEIRWLGRSPARPQIPGRRFELKAFGAMGDGHTPDTAAFTRALAAVRAAGGGTLVVPAGIYFTGPFDLPSRTELRLERGAVLRFSPRSDDYRGDGPKGFHPLIGISRAEDVLISGEGTISGGGSAWWPEALRFKAEANARHASSNTSPRPTMILFTRCQRVAVTGVTLTDAPCFNLVQNRCSDVRVEDVTITNPEHSPNTDGIDPKDCQRVLIARCRIDTGDDCIALGGSGGEREEDILVIDCTFLHGHGCSIGSGTASGVRHLLVRRCCFDGTDTGVRLKSSRGRGGLVEDVVYEDLTMRRVGVAVSISSYYDNTPIDRTLGHDTPQPLTATTPVWRDVVVRRVTARECRVRAGLIAGLPEQPAERIRLEDVTIDAPVGLTIGYADGVVLRRVTIHAAGGADVIAGATVHELVR